MSFEKKKQAWINLREEAVKQLEIDYHNLETEAGRTLVGSKLDDLRLELKFGREDELSKSFEVFKDGVKKRLYDHYYG